MGQSRVPHFTFLAWARLLCLLLMPFHHNHCAQAQTRISSITAYGFSFRQNLGASLALMLIAFLSVFVFVGFFTLCVHLCSPSYDAAGNPLDAAAATRIRRDQISREIKNCPILVYSRVKDLKIARGALECAVCLGGFQDSDKLRLLPKCHHVFHPDCIDAWLASRVSCPVCRTRVLFDYGERAIVVPIPTNTNTPSNPPPENPTAAVFGTTSPETELQLVVPNANEDVENDNTDSQAVTETNNVDETSECQKQGPPPEVRILNKLMRSHSTGHSLVEVEEEKIERGILRLPEHVRYQILENHSHWERRDAVLAGVCCSKKGFSRNESDVERWRFSMTPPFVYRLKAAATSPQRLPI